MAEAKRFQSKLVTLSGCGPSWMSDYIERCFLFGFKQLQIYHGQMSRLRYRVPQFINLGEFDVFWTFPCMLSPFIGMGMASCYSGRSTGLRIKPWFKPPLCHWCITCPSVSLFFSLKLSCFIALRVIPHFDSDRIERWHCGRHIKISSDLFFRTNLWNEYLYSHFTKENTLILT